MSLNGVIVSLGTGTYTVTRTAAGTRVDGRYVPGATSTFPIDAGIEPATGRELEDLPTGRRGNETIKIFTDTQLVAEDVSEDPDVIAYRGELWTVVKASFWEGFGENHCEAMACRPPTPIEP